MAFVPVRIRLVTPISMGRCVWFPSSRRPFIGRFHNININSPNWHSALLIYETRYERTYENPTHQTPFQVDAQVEVIRQLYRRGLSTRGHPCQETDSIANRH